MLMGAEVETEKEEPHFNLAGCVIRQGGERGPDGKRKKVTLSYDIPYIWNQKINDASELTDQKQTHRLREQTYDCWGKGGGKG